MKTSNGANSWMRNLSREKPFELGTFTRFLAVGLLNAAAGFLIFLLFFSALGFHYLLANVLVFISWVWFGFELQRRLVFRATASSAKFGRFVINQIVFTLVGTIVLWVLVEGYIIRPELAYVFTLTIVTIGIYVSSLLWVFDRTRQSSD